MNGKTIVIVGAGTGGVVLANRLRGLLAPAHRIVVVERSEIHAFAPSFLWLMVGQRRREAITRPVRSLLRSGVELVIGEAREIDAERRLVRIGSETLAWDTLVLASGAEMRFDVPGAETFFTLDGAERLHGVLREFSGKRVAVVVTSTPYKCPGAPAEGAMLIRDFLRKRGVDAAVDLYTPEPQPMPVAGAELGEAVRSMLGERGIGYHPSHEGFALEGGAMRFRDRDAVAADLVVTIPRHLAPAVVKTAGVANEGGWAAADPRTLATRDPNIFAIGDCAAVPLPGRWRADAPLSLPKAGVFAHAQAIVLADRIAAATEGRTDAAEFCGDGFCMLEAGGHLAGFAWGDFYATPAPEIHLKRVGPVWHAAKVLFESWWLAPPGARKRALGAIMRAGGGMARVPVEL
ncbi:MAG TPA: FAD/NAD(P)-binding oxidoreductase [Thermoanaerobaculia bacterium]|nr:FAD/NAD(P)-binding oxidoreductase [Thermoanaerobaculia bacterium]